jgi:hypothetical protein
VHLGDPDLRRDLRLGHIVHEAQVQDAAIALGQLAQRRRDRRAELDELEAGVLLAKGVPEARVVGASSDSEL